MHSQFFQTIFKEKSYTDYGCFKQGKPFLLYNLNSVTNISGRSHFNPTVKNYHAVSHIGQIPSSLTRAGAGSFSTCWELSQWPELSSRGLRVQRCRASTHPLHCTALERLSQHTGDTALPGQHQTAEMKTYSMEV